MLFDVFSQHENRAERSGQDFQLIRDLIGRCIQMRQSNKEQVILYSVKATGYGKFPCFVGFRIDLFVEPLK